MYSNKNYIKYSQYTNDHSICYLRIGVYQAVSTIKQTKELVLNADKPTRRKYFLIHGYRVNDKILREKLTLDSQTDIRIIEIQNLKEKLIEKFNSR